MARLASRSTENGADRGNPHCGMRGGSLLAVAAAFALALVSTAVAATGPTVGVATGQQVKLVSGVYVVVPVTYTCPAAITSDSITGDQINVTVTEKTGKALAQGSGVLGYSVFQGVASGSPVICDDQSHIVSVSVFPTGQSGVPALPFKGGAAVAQSSITIYTNTSPYSWLAFGAPASIKISG